MYHRPTVQTHYLDFVNGSVILGITINFPPKSNQIDQFRYIKIQPKTIDLRYQALGNNYRVCGVYTQEPGVEVYCVYWLNSNISKSVYSLSKKARYFCVISVTTVCICKFFCLNYLEEGNDMPRYHMPSQSKIKRIILIRIIAIWAAKMEHSKISFKEFSFIKHEMFVVESKYFSYRFGRLFENTFHETPELKTKKKYLFVPSFSEN